MSTNRMREFYNKEVVPAMIKKFSYKNVMEVPKIEKIVINMGVGEAKDNPKVLESCLLYTSSPRPYGVRLTNTMYLVWHLSTRWILWARISITQSG